MSKKKTCTSPLPESNLVMGKNGVIKCKDGQKLNAHIHSQMPNVPEGTELVICTRPMFEHLQTAAYLTHHLIHAA